MNGKTKIEESAAQGAAKAIIKTVGMIVRECGVRAVGGQPNERRRSVINQLVEKLRELRRENRRLRRQ